MRLTCRTLRIRSRNASVSGLSRYPTTIGSRAENRQQTHYLSVPAAGQYGNQQLIRREPMRGPKPPPITAVGPALEHRVAHIATGQPDPFEIRRLERKQGQQMIVPAGHPPGS